MKASSKRFLSIIVAILVFIASLFIYSSLIRSVYSDIKNLRAEVVSRLELINKNQASVKQVNQLLNEYQDISKIQETISSVLPLEQNMPQSVNQISGLAKFNNLAINFLSAQQLAIKPSTQPGLVNGLGVLRLNFGLTGTYENFKTFIQGLDTNITLLDLVTLKTESKATSKNGELSYTMTVDTYYQVK